VIGSPKSSLQLYLEYGVPVALVTDDEAVLRSNITLEYVKAAQRHTLDYRTLKRIARNSIASSSRSA
jgi:adenosine deaminase